MNVVYSCSDSYSPLAGISLYSLLCNNKSVEELNVYIVENKISDKNRNKFVKLCADFNRKLTFVPIADIEQMAGTSIDIGRWNISTFARLFEATLLPKDVEKVIHIDCDTMIMSSLEPLWEKDMTGKIVAGALECIGDNYKTEIGMKVTDTYINAGNIMLNLKKIREDNTEELFKEFIRKNKILSFVDQPVLNACTTNEEKLVVPLNYNTFAINFYLKYKNISKVKHMTQYYSEEEVAQAVANPCVVHFTTCFMDGTRPWMKNNIHPMLDKYLEFKSKSPWADEPLWEDPRNGVKRFCYKMFRILPEGFVASSVGLVHNHIIPLKNKLKE